MPHPGSATGHLIAPGDHHTLLHIQVHFSVDFQADFENVRWHDVALTWNHTKDYNRSRKLCFHHPGHLPVIRSNPAMVLAVITWISAHLRSRSLNIVSLSDMIEGSYRSWDLYTTGQLVDGLQQQKKKKKRKPVLIKRKWNHVVFSRATILSFHPVLGMTTGLGEGNLSIQICLTPLKSLTLSRSCRGVGRYIYHHLLIYIW